MLSASLVNEGVGSVGREGGGGPKFFMLTPNLHIFRRFPIFLGLMEALINKHDHYSIALPAIRLIDRSVH